MPDARLLQQMQFLIEADKVKSIFRRNRILHGERLENDAEHSWQLALMAIVLSEQADPHVSTEGVKGAELQNRRRLAGAVGLRGRSYRRCEKRRFYFLKKVPARYGIIGQAAFR